MPDILRGSKVKAVIVLKKGVEKSQDTLNSIHNFVKDNISAYAKPREYDFVDFLPKTKLGKVDYRKLESESAEESSVSETA